MINPSVSVPVEPCPFCAGKDIRFTRHRGLGRVPGEDVFSMGCYNCGATFPSCYRDGLLQKAWNRRAASAQAAVEVDTLRKALRGLIDNSCRADWPKDLYDAAESALGRETVGGGE